MAGVMVALAVSVSPFRRAPWLLLAIVLSTCQVWQAAGDETMPESQTELLLELKKLRAEVAELQGKQKSDGVAEQQSASKLPAPQKVQAGQVKSSPSPAAAPSAGQPELAADGAHDPCMSSPMFASLHAALQRLALLEQDPVEASYKIHAAWEADPSIFDVCPVGVITALVYLSIAQDRDWKYRLLHRATYLLYSTSGLAAKMEEGKWPMSDRLIRTMYHNSETAGKSAVRFIDERAQASSGQVVADLNLQEAVTLALRHRDTIPVHFQRVLFYHFYYEELSPCACRTRSWCLPFWLRHFTNNSVDIWLAARDEAKTLYRMDRSGCFRKLHLSLAENYFAEEFDLMYVFEINALMHPRARIISAKRILLTPAFALHEAQMANFEELGISVLSDDAVLKPPNPALRQMLSEAWVRRMQKSWQKPKDRLLVYAAEIRPLKNQVEFLQGLLQSSQAGSPAAVRRLKDLTIVIAGRCDGNQTYCTEVVDIAKQVNEEGWVNIVVAASLQDHELTQVYAAAAGLVLFSQVDCNPRAVYEAMWTDTPFFITTSTRVPVRIQHLGYVSSGQRVLAEELADFVEFCEAGGFVGRPVEFARAHLDEATVYKEMISWMDSRYVNGRVLDNILVSEDAAGLASGLGQLLGGSKGAGALLAGLGGAGSRFR